MMRLPLSLATLALFVMLGSGCGGMLFTLQPLNPPGVLTEDRVAVTLAKGDLSVTVGPLAHVQNKYMSFAVLVRNDSDRALPVRIQDARVLVNGGPVAMLDEAFYEKQRRMARWAGALGAASSSLASSNALNAQDPYAGTSDERRGNVQSTALSQQMERSLAAQQLFQASLNADQALSAQRKELGEQYAAELAKASSVAWNDTYELRSSIPSSVQLWEQYRWRDETVPPRSWLLRGLFTEPDSAEALLGEKGGRITVEIDLGGERFTYAFDTVLLRSYGEVSAAIKDAQAHATAMRQK